MFPSIPNPRDGQHALLQRGRLCTLLSAIATLSVLFLVEERMMAAAPSRPNIVLIICDDMGFSDLGCYGGEIQTPHINALARQGMRFTQFYNSSVCSTTRTELFSGLYARNGACLSHQMVTIAQVLRAAGYHTSISGKWNVQRQEPSSPLAWGFEEFYGMPDGGSNYFDPARPDPKSAETPGNRRLFFHNNEQLTDFPSDYYLTDAITDHAISMIRRYSDSGDPFFVYVGYTSPHSPLQAKPKDIARYEKKYQAGWDQLRRERFQRQHDLGLINGNWALPQRDPEVMPWDQVPHHDWEDKRMAVYAAMVDSMDQGVGKIRQALTETGVDRNTLVLFLSDNGAASADLNGSRPYIGDGLGDRYDSSAEPGGIDSYLLCGAGWAYLQNTPFRRFKAWTHEGGIATPLIAWAPGLVPPDTVMHDVGHVIDIMPTLAELAGTEYPETWKGQQIIPCEGKSLLPVLKGGMRHGHDELYWYNPHLGAGAIRQRRWKLVSEGVDMPWELYDLPADRTETTDLSGDEPDRVRSMREKWGAWAEKMGLQGKLPPRGKPQPNTGQPVQSVGQGNQR